MKPGLFAELERRSVIRAAALYSGAIWAVGAAYVDLQALRDETTVLGRKKN